MKVFFSLLIIFPLLMNIKSPIFDWNWNWNWNFNWELKWKEFLANFKSKIPDFIKNLQDKTKDFLEKTEEYKNNIIKELNSKVVELCENIRQEKENIEEKMKSLIEKTTEASKYLSYKVCDKANIDYEVCRNDKKKLFTNLLNAVKENFGQCSVIVEQLSKLSDDREQNLKYFLFMVLSLLENPDAIEEGKSQIIYDIINCLTDKFQDYWPSINSSIFDTELRFNTKLDIIKLLLNSYSNIVNVIHFEVFDGFIQESNKTTGLISDERAKQIYKAIFNISKKFNEFGSLFHNISADLALDVVLNTGNLNTEGDIDFKWIKDDNKGIRINLHANYLLREKNANSLQAIIFESPLVDLRGKKETEGGISNIFVGITLYDKEGNEIFVKDIDLEKYRPIIYFKKRLFSAMKTCLFYNEEKDEMDDEGITTAYEILDGEEYIKCIPAHLTSFAIGSNGTEIDTSDNEETNIITNTDINTYISDIATIEIIDETTKVDTKDNNDNNSKNNNNNNNNNNKPKNDIVTNNNNGINNNIITSMILILLPLL